MKVEKELDGTEISYYVSIFSNGGSTGWKSKLKQIWHIIRTGEPYRDYMIFNQQEFDKLKSL